MDSIKHSFVVSEKDAQFVSFSDAVHKHHQEPFI